HCERREVADTVNEAERQDEPGVVALQPAQRGFDPVTPARVAVEQPHAKIAAEPEIALVAGEAAQPSGEKQQHRIDKALSRGETGKQDDRLALEEGPGKDDGVETGAVMSNELIDIHGLFFWARPTARSAAQVENTRSSRQAILPC